MNSLDLNLLTNTLQQFFQNNAHLLPNYVPDASKVSILLWAVKDKANSFILKIANQKYLSSYRTDKNGATYWKFKEVEESKLTSPEPIPSPNSNSIKLDPITKFQKRQAKTELLNHGKSDNFESIATNEQSN